MRDAGYVVLRSTPVRGQADEWMLVLAAENLSPALDRVAWDFVVSVPADQSERAGEALAAYDIEHVPGPDDAPEESGSAWGWTVAFYVVAALFCFFLVTGNRHSNSFWFSRGSADAELILTREPWRVITALTLHADLVHVLGNCLFGALFFGAAFRSLGAGLGGLVVLLAGAGGNWTTALFYGSHHSSVGASTAVFGAIGLLGGLAWVRRKRRGQRGSRAWAPIAAALALLAMIGMGQRADLIAHLLGLAVGSALGLVVAISLPRRPGPIEQWLLGGFSVALLIGCWELALR
jgi:membrane associated rhomboid family serine protease